MRLLLDTCVWLWFHSARHRLLPPVHERICGPDSQVYLSAASGWEIATKHAPGQAPPPRSAPHLHPHQPSLDTDGPMTSRGTIPLRQVWEMLDACAPGHEVVARPHRFHVRCKGPNLHGPAEGPPREAP